MSFSIEDFFSKCGQIRRKLSEETADLESFTEEIFNGKLHFCTVIQYDNRIRWKLECSAFESESDRLRVGLFL